jgi:hypothetical protein
MATLDQAALNLNAKVKSLNDAAKAFLDLVKKEKDADAAAAAVQKRFVEKPTDEKLGRDLADAYDKARRAQEEARKGYYKFAAANAAFQAALADYMNAVFLAAKSCPKEGFSAAGD